MEPLRCKECGIAINLTITDRRRIAITGKVPKEYQLCPKCKAKKSEPKPKPTFPVASSPPKRNKFKDGMPEGEK